MKKTEEPLRVNNINELRAVRRGTVEIPQREGKTVQGVFRRCIDSQVHLFVRALNPNKVYEAYYDSDSSGNFPHDSIPQGDTIVYSIKSWRGRRINRILSRRGL